MQKFRHCWKVHGQLPGYHDFKEAAQSLFDSCKKLTGATSGYIALLSEDGMENEVLFVHAGGLPCAVDETLPMPVRGLRGEVFRNAKAMYDNDFSKSEWITLLPEGHTAISNVLIAPMLVHGKVVGLLGLANKRGGFNNDDAEWHRHSLILSQLHSFGKDLMMH